MLPSIAPLAAPRRDGDDRRLSRPRRRIAVVATLVGLATLLAGCVAPKNQTTVGTPAPDPAQSAGPLASFYDQALEWTTCDEGECATAQVPIDYANPAAGSIGLALARVKASGDNPIGSLLVDPGGPGASGVDFLQGAKSGISKEVLERYDLVGFDPRGVQRSSPVSCLSGPGMDELLAADQDYSTDAGIQHAIDMYGDYGNACLKKTGSVLGHIDTVSAARDMDILRAALGDEKLSYFGFSYGTDLGATYAALFPTKVGRMVLDGALPPTLTNDEAAAGQAAGFEGALRAYVADCQAGSGCPLTGSVDDGMAQIKRLLDQARKDPLPTSTDREVTGSLAFAGIAEALYTQQLWPALTQGLQGAIRKGDGTVLLELADHYSDRGTDGKYTSNVLDAFNAVSCLDHPEDATPSFDAMRAQAAQIEAVAPTVGRYFEYSDATCAKWPVKSTGALADYSAKGAPPIVVVGTTGDPATPYPWAVQLASMLSTGDLLTYKGEGHTAYFSHDACVVKAVDTYLLGGAAPPAGTHC